MGKIYSVEIRKRFEVMNLLTSGILTEKQAAEELGISLRQVQRIKKRFISEGCSIESLRYKRVHPQINKIPESIVSKVIKLKEEGQHHSCQHISEILPGLLTREEKIWFKKWGKYHYHLSHQSIRNILKQAGVYNRVYERTDPAIRFEMANFGELVQMDTSPFSGLCGYKRVYLILNLDDHSRMILAGRFFLSDNVYNNMAILREMIERYGICKMVYTDNASLFNYLRYKRWSWRVYKDRMKFYDNDTEKQVITEIEEALLQLGIPLLTHYPGHPRAKGKIERIFRFINNKFVKEYKGKINRLNQLNNLFTNWINWYNRNWINREIGTYPENRRTPSVFKPVPKEVNLDDVFCLKEIRKVDRTNSFSYEGKIYTLNHQNNLVGRKVSLHIHPGKKIRVWNNKEFIEEIPLKCDILSFKQ